jgi:hypothetical protein
MGKNYIPESDAGFNSWQVNLMSNVASRAPRLNIPLDEVAAVQTKQSRWTTAYAAVLNPATCTKGAVTEKQEARKDYEAALRRLVRTYLTYNPALSDQDREDMGLPIHKTTHTDAPVATTIPYVVVILNLIRHLRFDFSGSEGSKAKPEGQHGMELAARIGGEKPAGVHELTRSYFDTHTPLTIEFTEADRGQTFWYAVRWENTTGEKGPWSEIMSAVIP